MKGGNEDFEVTKYHNTTNMWKILRMSKTISLPPWLIVTCGNFVAFWSELKLRNWSHRFMLQFTLYPKHSVNVFVHKILQQTLTRRSTTSRPNVKCSCFSHQIFDQVFQFNVCGHNGKLRNSFCGRNENTHRVLLHIYFSWHSTGRFKTWKNTLQVHHPFMKMYRI